MDLMTAKLLSRKTEDVSDQLQHFEDRTDVGEMSEKPEFQSPNEDELDEDDPEPLASLLATTHTPAALPPGSQSPADETLAPPVSTNNSRSEPHKSPSQGHPNTLDGMSSVETSTQNEPHAQHLLTDVPDSIRFRLLTQRRGPDPNSPKGRVDRMSAQSVTIRTL